jgi:integrase/recombinase XerD
MKRKDFENRDGSMRFNLTPIMSYGPREGIRADIMLDIRCAKNLDNIAYFPCKYRVTYRRIRAYYPAMDLTIEQFDTLHGQVRNQYLVETKRALLAGFERITDTINEILAKEAFTLDKLARHLSQGTKDSLFTAFDARIKELEDSGKIGSMNWYSCAKKSIEKFTKKDLTFSHITPEWLKKYQNRLLEEGKEFTTISINMRALRAILNQAKASGAITQAQYPFRSNERERDKYQIPEAAGIKRALSEVQLLEIFKYSLHPNDEKYRDLWIFSFYCNGANLSDILKFKYENITGNVLEWYRGKTLTTDRKKIKIRAVITDEMHDIINRYGQRDKKPGNYIFPYLKPGLAPLQEKIIMQDVIHRVNKRMKKIGKALGYGDVTTYWARHTFASISRRKEVSLFSISKSLGHKNLTTTQIYLDSLSDDELMENAAKMPRR